MITASYPHTYQQHIMYPSMIHEQKYQPTGWGTTTTTTTSSTYTSPQTTPRGIQPQPHIMSQQHVQQPHVISTLPNTTVLPSIWSYPPITTTSTTSTSTSTSQPIFTSTSFQSPISTTTTSISTEHKYTHIKRSRSFDLTLDELMIPKKKNRLSLEMNDVDVDVDVDIDVDDKKQEYPDVEIDEKPSTSGKSILSIPSSQCYAIVPYTGPLENDDTTSHAPSTYTSLRLNPLLLSSTNENKNTLHHMLHDTKHQQPQTTRALVLYQPPPILKSNLELDAESSQEEDDTTTTTSTSTSIPSLHVFKKPNMMKPNNQHEQKVNQLCHAMSSSLITTPTIATTSTTTSTSTIQQQQPFQFKSTYPIMTTSATTSFPSSLIFSPPSPSTSTSSFTSTFTSPLLSNLLPITHPSTSTSTSTSPSPSSSFSSPHTHKRRHDPLNDTIDMENDHPIRRLRMEEMS